MKKISGPKIVRIKTKKSPEQIESERILREHKKNLPHNPFINIGKMIEREVEERESSA